MPNITGSFAWGGAGYGTTGTGAFVSNQPISLPNYLWGGASGSGKQGISMNANFISDIYSENAIVQVASIRLFKLCRI